MMWSRFFRFMIFSSLMGLASHSLAYGPDPIQTGKTSRPTDEFHLIPLTQSGWTQVTFSRIPPNQVVFQDDGILVKVKKSASPLVFKLGEGVPVRSFRVDASWTGTKQIEKSAFDEDSVLRFGLVAVGDQKLNAVHRLFAADWVKKLFDLAPPGAGLDKIYFFNTTNREQLLGQKRNHPSSELIHEEILTVVKDGQADFSLVKTLEKTTRAAALWISVDGDDTKSEFQLTLRRIALNQPAN